MLSFKKKRTCLFSATSLIKSACQSSKLGEKILPVLYYIYLNH